jgi:hypothetical protein
MGSRVNSFEFLFINHVSSIALFAEIEVEAVITLVPNILDGHLLTSVTLYILLDSLSRLNNQFYFVLVSVTPHFQVLVGSCEVAVLAKTKMVAIGADKASTYDWSHVATHAFILVVSSQAIS